MTETNNPVQALVDHVNGLIYDAYIDGDSGSVASWNLRYLTVERVQEMLDRLNPSETHFSISGIPRDGYLYRATYAPSGDTEGVMIRMVPAGKDPQT